MKTLRLVLLLMLAVLLPVRGAVAAAMMCPPTGSGSPHAMHAAGDPAGHVHGAEHTQMQMHMHQHQHEPTPAPTHAHAAGDACTLCAVCCTTAPLLADVPGLGAPVALRAAPFPALRTEAPSFVSDGPERPPRSS